MSSQAASLGLKVSVSCVSHFITSTLSQVSLQICYMICWKGSFHLNLLFALRLLKYFTLEYLNQRITSFPYQHTDGKWTSSHSQTFMTWGTIGGNGHENSALLRLLALLVGSKVPEGIAAWEVLVDLKEVVELALCPSFSDETLDYFVCKISDQRQTLQEPFPDFRLRPKHHYPTLVKCFGPLVHVWTMRFEAKHRFFERVVHDAQNFKNVLKTLAIRY